MNELAIIFEKLGIDTLDVLEAAGSKWNFLPFRPGLVGGHCIGVDPYYLTHKATMIGYHPEVILAGRRINDGMGEYVAEQTVKMLINEGRKVKGGNVLVMGLTFKENCPDLRNSRVIDVVRELQEYGVNVMVWDPVAVNGEALEEYGIELLELDDINNIEAVVAAVAHDEILEVDLNSLVNKTGKNAPFMDVKSAFDRDTLRTIGFDVWRL
jgi:UDP-N-acetyl-D-galactosamine dehydrogenase